MDMNLVGLDVGFSATRRTSGVARFQSGRLNLGRATSYWGSRAAVLGTGNATVAAIDAPLVPRQHWERWEPRACERLFTLGLFQRRCKPGLSHVRGTGRQLRSAGLETADQLTPMLIGDSGLSFPRVLLEKNLIEAFPNAFLGVSIPDSRYKLMPKLKRGKKFDWLYGQWLEIEASSSLVHSVDPTGQLFQRFMRCNDHEERAALVCLLTAGVVALGQFTAIGDSMGGYFFLPSFDFWSDWARQELEKQRGRVETLEILVNGERFR